MIRSASSVTAGPDPWRGAPTGAVVAAGAVVGSDPQKLWEEPDRKGNEGAVCSSELGSTLENESSVEATRLASPAGDQCGD